MGVKLCTWCKSKATRFGVFRGSKSYKHIISRCDVHYGGGEKNPALATFYKYKEAKIYVDMLNVKRKL
jgi:hypothetical protein